MADDKPPRRRRTGTVLWPIPGAPAEDTPHTVLQDLPEPPAAPARGRLKAGDLLNHIFEISGLINRGGMSEVYRGVNVVTDESVAIKVILPHLADEPSVEAMFLREAKTLLRFSHPALLQYRLAAREPNLDVLYLVTEFVDGPGLDEAMDDFRPGVDETVAFARRLCQGLRVAHDLGAIHRDLSPDNILLPDRRLELAKIIDFGIVKDLASSNPTILGNAFAGKLSYVAPEQLGDFGRDVGPWTDIYSLGLVLLALVSGEDADMGSNLVNAVDRRRAGVDVSGAPAPLRPVFEGMLKADPKLRLRSMAEVLRVLDAVADRPVSVWTPSDAPSPDRETPAARMDEPSAEPPVAEAEVAVDEALSAALEAQVSEAALPEPVVAPGPTEPDFAVGGEPATEAAIGLAPPPVASEPVASLPLAEAGDAPVEAAPEPPDVAAPALSFTAAAEVEPAVETSPTADEPGEAGTDSAAIAPTDEPPALREIVEAPAPAPAVAAEAVADPGSSEPVGPVETPATVVDAAIGAPAASVVTAEPAVTAAAPQPDLKVEDELSPPEAAPEPAERPPDLVPTAASQPAPAPKAETPAVRRKNQPSAAVAPAQVAEPQPPPVRSRPKPVVEPPPVAAARAAVAVEKASAENRPLAGRGSSRKRENPPEPPGAPSAAIPVATIPPTLPTAGDPVPRRTPSPRPRPPVRAAVAEEPTQPPARAPSPRQRKPAAEPPAAPRPAVEAPPPTAPTPAADVRRGPRTARPAAPAPESLTAPPAGPARETTQPARKRAAEPSAAPTPAVEAPRPAPSPPTFAAAARLIPPRPRPATPAPEIKPDQPAADAAVAEDADARIRAARVWRRIRAWRTERPARVAEPDAGAGEASAASAPAYVQASPATAPAASTPSPPAVSQPPPAAAVSTPSLPAISQRPATGPWLERFARTPLAASASPARGQAANPGRASLVGLAVWVMSLRVTQILLTAILVTVVFLVFNHKPSPVVTHPTVVVASAAPTTQVALAPPPTVTAPAAISTAAADKARRKAARRAEAAEAAAANSVPPPPAFEPPIVVAPPPPPPVAANTAVVAAPVQKPRKWCPFFPIRCPKPSAAATTPAASSPSNAAGE